jgi:hypothetical protein
MKESAAAICCAPVTSADEFKKIDELLGNPLIMNLPTLYFRTQGHLVAIREKEAFSPMRIALESSPYIPYMENLLMQPVRVSASCVSGVA